MKDLAVLAIAAHRDDIEQTCGGTLLKMAEGGHRAGVLDLSQGEMGTRGTAEERALEAEEAARILRLCWRRALDIPDARVENSWENRLKVARVIRQTRPRVVILPYWKGRHPDHYTASRLGYEGCFLAGLAKLRVEDASGPLDSARGGEAAELEDCLEPHRPFKIVYATLYYDVRPTFVVDISRQFEARFEALMAYRSQFSDQQAGSDIFPARADIRARVEAMARFYGMLAGVDYGEPFLAKEVGLVEDLTLLPVRSL
ncbi:MAG: bacillithiol biosynthesis deacetylase BshB1 [Acidobacteria bacterium]|nr:bacillithiol biosynthesis deacetylase BshB1 [Acidobacteriota bacterium]MBV9623362.1 bacillithiol biosynthesis deacetylase BshB1 [Acidobacteriota bacterium]